MPTITGPVLHDGALVAVEVGLAHGTAQALRALHQAVPPPLARSALLDTGAESSALDTALVVQLRALGVPVITVTPTNVPALGGMGLAPVLIVNLTLLHPQGNNLVHRSLLIQELPIGQLGYDVLIGRDVLSRCDFLYEGRRRRFDLTW